MSSQLLNPQVFTERFCKQLSQHDQTISCVIKGELEVHLSATGGKEQTLFLDNAYAKYKTAPEDAEQIFSLYIESAQETLQSSGAKAVDTTRIVPVIKDTAYLAEVNASLQETGRGAIDLYHEPLNEHLIILYAIDTDVNIKYLSRDEIAALPLQQDALRQHAIENLKNILPDIQRREEAGLYMVTAGGTYESSLILINSLWKKTTFDVDGDIVITIPSRDVLLVTGSHDDEGIKQLRSMAKEVVEQNSYYLTADLFVWDEDKQAWKFFE
jgi:uncharacterized protein YtpQ (UPF0354 family)